jgi:hypothetical protein
MSSDAREVTIEVGEYDRNRRYTVERGTKYVHAQVHFGIHDSAEDVTAVAVAAAYKKARELWAFRHDEIDYTVTIFTCQVLVELRWRPI